MSLTHDEKWRLTYYERVIPEAEELIKIKKENLASYKEEYRGLVQKREAEFKCPGCGHIEHGRARCAAMVRKCDDSYSTWTEQCGCETVCQ